MFTLRLFSTVGHYCTGCHFRSASLLRLVSIQHELHFSTAYHLYQGTVLQSDNFTQCYISTKVVLLSCYNFAQRYFNIRFDLPQPSIFHGKTLYRTLLLYGKIFNVSSLRVIVFRNKN